MNDRPRPRVDTDVVSDAMTARVLARASELDVLRRAGATVAELRAAATEAGISAEAFNDALAEMQNAEVARPMAGVARRTRLKAMVSAVALVIGLGLFALMRTTPVVPATVEHALDLRCLTPPQVAELVRPLTDPKTTTITFSSHTPDRFTIRATSGDIARVRSVLEQQQASCPRP